MEETIIHDFLDCLQSTIGKSIQKTNEQNVYQIDGLGNFIIKTEEMTFTAEIKAASESENNNTFALHSSDSDEECIAIYPVVNGAFVNSPSCIKVRIPDLKDFEFYGIDGKYFPKENVYAELENIFNIYNNPQKYIRKQGKK